jgi:hypothetical protein
MSNIKVKISQEAKISINSKSPQKYKIIQLGEDFINFSKIEIGSDKEEIYSLSIKFQKI